MNEPVEQPNQSPFEQPFDINLYPFDEFPIFGENLNNMRNCNECNRLIPILPILLDKKTIFICNQCKNKDKNGIPPKATFE